MSEEREKPKLPSFTTMAKNFAKDLATYVAQGAPNVSEKNYQARLDTLKQIREQHLDYLATCDEVPITEERITFVCKLEKIKVVNHQFGSTYKMILLSDSGYKLYGSIPTKLLQDFDCNISDIEGLQISFDATVEQSDSDRYFGFFKRPTKLNIYKESA